MKKLTALLLALCMLLAVVPALGEDFSGTWYMVLEDVNVGTLEMNADGTFSMTVQASDEATTAEGTWEATDAGVTLTVNGDPAEAIYDAEAGTINMNGADSKMEFNEEGQLLISDGGGTMYLEKRTEE